MPNEILHLYLERCGVAQAYVLFIMAYAAEQNVHMTWGEAVVQAIQTTPKFARDWINPN